MVKSQCSMIIEGVGFISPDARPPPCVLINVGEKKLMAVRNSNSSHVPPSPSHQGRGRGVTITP